MAAGAFVLAASSACSGQNTTDIPSYSQGTEGNGLQGGATPPFDFIPKNGPPVVDASCFVGDATTCGVRFSKDIFPNMMSTGPWKCASINGGCHGGAQKPIMSDSDINGTYNALVNYELLGDHTQYIIPCNGDTTQSAIVCNLDQSNPCGDLMPLTSEGATRPSSADIQLITQWVACGSPNN